jgi:hypothetical protein
LFFLNAALNRLHPREIRHRTGQVAPMAEAVHSNSFTTAPAGEIGPLNFRVLRHQVLRHHKGADRESVFRVMFGSESPSAYTLMRPNLRDLPLFEQAHAFALPNAKQVTNELQLVMLGRDHRQG